MNVTYKSLAELTEKAIHILYRELGTANMVRFLRAYEKWTAEEDAQLSQKYRSGLRVNELAKLFARQPGAIESRLWKLGLAT